MNEVMENNILKKPIRILHMIGNLDIGGSQAFIINLYKSIDRNKVQFDFVIDHPSMVQLVPLIKSLGGKIHVMPGFNGVNYIEVLHAWDSFFENNKEYKVLHSHVRSYASLYIYIAKKHGLTTIIHSHSTSNGKGLASLYKSALQYPLRYLADYCFACSEEAGKWLYGEKATLQSNYRLIPNGIDQKRFAFNAEKRVLMRNELGINKDTFVLGHVGRFIVPKNHKFLVELFAEYHKENSNSKLLLVGDGELCEAVKQLIEQLDIGDAAIMVGSKTNTEDYYQAMDVFVFPSLWEGLPVSVVEAQANGLICLLSDVITQNVDLTDQVKYLSLNEKKRWLEEIAATQKKDRKAATAENQMKLQPFDAVIVAKKLQDFYLEQDERTRR